MTTNTTIEQAEAAQRIIDQAAQLEALQQQQRDEQAAQAARDAATLAGVRSTFNSAVRSHEAAVDYWHSRISDAVIAMQLVIEAGREVLQTEAALIAAGDDLGQVQATQAGEWRLAPRSVAEAHRFREANMSALYRRKVALFTAAGLDPNHPTVQYPFGDSDAARAVIKALSE